MKTKLHNNLCKTMMSKNNGHRDFLINTCISIINESNFPNQKIWDGRKKYSYLEYYILLKTFVNRFEYEQNHKILENYDYLTREWEELKGK